MQDGRSDAQIARLLNATVPSVWRWRKAYERNGKQALIAKPATGRPRQLTRRQRDGLVSRLLKGATSQGFDTELWTCPRVAQLIERCYGVRYHVDHIPRLLGSLGFSCQKPERRAVERDEAAIQRWMQQDWPRIKKRST
jgi:transposase